MTMNLDIIGADNGHGIATWTERDAIIHALGVGAGQDDPSRELQFTTENSEGVVQQALPAFGVIQCMNHAKRPKLGDFDISQTLHAEQGLTMHRPIPARGTARASFAVRNIFDQGKAALVVHEMTLTDAETDQLLMTATGSLYVRGEGGFGGENQPKTAWLTAERDPDHRVAFTVRPDQALLYRMSGDRNRLHSDPKFAVQAGFKRPILHGMCTYGIACRLLVNVFCDGDASRVTAMHARFSRPVLPGEQLTVEAWDQEGKVQFVTRNSVGDIVLDKGTFEYTEEMG